MILNTGSRTDIPAYYSTWFLNRIREGEVMARNPYDPRKVSRYRLTPELVDMIVFCTKNPAPMIPHLEELADYGQFWFVTITPYGRDIEPNVPPVDTAIRSVIRLHQELRRLYEASGRDPETARRAISWRYDPILIDDRYTVDRHIADFTRMSEALAGSCDSCVISFIDLYEKTKRNFPEVRQVREEERLRIGAEFSGIAKKHGMILRTCLEGTELKRFGVDTEGCMTKKVLERALGSSLQVPASQLMTREGCSCLLGNDIGAYNTCAHGCRYCYANYDQDSVRYNRRKHDPDSPMLIGRPMPDDIITDSRQVRFGTGQQMLDLYSFIQPSSRST